MSDPKGTVGAFEAVAVIGAGTMGNGIAQTFAVHGVTTFMVDVEDRFLERGMATIETRSIPFVTPPATISIVTAMNRTWNRNAARGPCKR